MARTTAETIYTELRQQILSGKFRPAERLVESVLAESLQASRHHVRAALERLQVDGLVEIEANKGARVSSLSLDNVIDMYVAREGMEAEIVRLAVERITEEQLDQLKACLQSMHDAFESQKFERYSELNQQFHGIIYDASENKTLPELIAQIRLRLARLNLRVILLPGRGDNSYEEHTAIYDGLAERNIEKATRAVRQHISAVRNDVKNGWNIIGM